MKILSAAMLAGVLLTVLGFVTRPSPVSAADGGKNLKVLPTTLSKAEIKKIMKNIADSLGVQCDFCHDTEDMSKDTENKEIARSMMKMTAELNKTYFKGEQRVKCVTCHNGKKEPK
jgi:hypothetical protein